MIVLISVCPVFRSLPASGDFGLRRELDQRRDVGGQVRRRVRVRDAFADRRVGVDHARRNRRIVLPRARARSSRSIWCAGDSVMKISVLPHQTITRRSSSLSALNLRMSAIDLLGEILLVLALLDVRAVEPLHVPLIEHRRPRPDLSRARAGPARAAPARARRRSSPRRSSRPRRCPSRRTRDRRAPASGTTSLIFGERPSVRLPRRIVPICVSEPIGLANPLRMARTPAMVVVLTAPRPTSSMPSLPRAGAMSTGVGMNGESYRCQLSLSARPAVSSVDRRRQLIACVS